MAKIIISEEELDIIVRRHMHKLAGANWMRRKYPDAHVESALKEIREHAFTIQQYEEWKKHKRHLRKTEEFWSPPSNYKMIPEDIRLEENARKLAMMKKGEIFWQQMLGGCPTIKKLKDGQYVIANKRFKNAWKAAKFLVHR